MTPRLRKILTTAIVIVTLVVLLPLLVYLPPVQRAVINYAEQWVASHTPIGLSVERFSLKFPLRLALHDVVLTTSESDTLAVAGELQADVALMPLITQKVVVRNVSLHDARAYYVTPDSSLNLAAEIGRVALLDGIIGLSDSHVNVGEIALDNSTIAMSYKSMPDTTAQDTSATVAWDVELERLHLSHIDLAMSMPGVFDTLQVYMGDGELAGANISLARQWVDVHSVDIAQGHYRYVALPSNEDDTSVESTADVPIDTTATQPWEVRVHQVKLVDNNASYITSTAEPTRGMDFSHIEASRINLQLSDVYNRGGELHLSLDTLSFYERSGLCVTQAQCHFAMTDDGVLRLSDFMLRTPFSDLSATADVDMSLMDNNPEAQLRLLAQAHLSCRDIAYIYPDAAQYYIHSTRHRSILPIHDVIAANIDIDGVARDIVVDKFNLSQMGVFTLDSRARLSNPLDEKKRSVNVSCAFRSARRFSLENFVSDTLLAQRLVAEPIKADVNAHVSGSNVEADATLHCIGGDILANADYNLNSESYNVRAKVHKLPMNVFMPGDTIGMLTAQAELNGAHFSFDKPETTLYAHLHLDTLEYRHYLYHNIDVMAQVVEQQWSMNASSDLQELDLHIDAQGALMPDMLTANVSAQVGKVDLEALHLSQTPFDVAGSIKTEMVVSNIDSIIQADVAINDLVVGLDEYRYYANPISLLAASDITYSYVDVRTGDFEVNISSDTGLKNLQPSFERLTQLVDTIFQTQRLDMDELHRGLPPFVFTARMAGNNVVQRYINSKGIRLASLDFEASNDSLFNLAGVVNRLEVSGMLLDTVTIDAYEKTERLNYRLALGNRPGNMDELAHMHVEGFLSGNSTRLYCLQSNRQQEIGFLFGCKIDFLGDVVQLTFGPKEPIIGYKKWLLNKDNYLSINHVQHTIDTDVRLSYDNSHLFITTEDRRNKDVSGTHIDLQNIELSEWLSVSSLVAPMSGNLSADVYIDMPPKGIEAAGAFDIVDYVYNNTRIGTLHAELEYILDDEGGNDVKALMSHDGNDVLEATAYLGVGKPQPIIGEISIDKMPLSVANAFFPPNMGAFAGELNSKLTVTGTLDAPVVNGNVRFDKATMQFNQIGASLALSDDKVLIQNSRLIFDNYYIRGVNNNPLNIVGAINFKRLNDIGVNLTIEGENFQPIGIKENRSSIIYGSVFTDMDIKVRGTLNDLKVSGGVSLLSGTNATYVMQSGSSLSSTDYSDMVSFVSFADTVATNKSNEKIEKRTNNFAATIGIDIDDGVQLGVNLSVDGKNRVDLVGGGELLYTATALGDNRVSGRYNLTGGFVRYTPPIISQKIFNIEDGSYVSWNGEMLDPLFNITAIQTQRSTVKSGDESRLVDFEISIKLTNTLKDLDIAFDLATTEDLTIDNELQALTAEQRETKALNMLLYNSYSDLATAVDNYSINDPLNMFLEYELNTWAQRTLRGVDLTFGIDNYGIDGTGTQRTDYSYQFSKSLLDNRLKVVVGGSYASNQDVTQNLSENLIDDISLEYRLDKRENMYLKVFRQTGYESIIEGEITQTGIGFMYRKQVQSFLDFFRRKPKPETKNKQENSAPADTIVNINYTPINTIVPQAHEEKEEVEP